MIGTLSCPCGGCLTCRINRRRVWSHRILLESYKHPESCFVTLTYDNNNVPEQLVKSDYQNFLKRLRRSLEPRKIRYFIAGEYGDFTGRPHFHGAIFNLDAYSAGGQSGREGLVHEAWKPNGFTYVGSLTWQSAQYIAGYVTKKVVEGEKNVRPFCRMSLRPGIGATAMQDVARSLSCEAGLDSTVERGDVPSTIDYGKRKLPLGRYLRRVLRGELGFASKDTPSEATRMFILQQEAQKLETRAALRKEGYSSFDAQQLMLDMNKQKIINMESRFKVRDSKKGVLR